MTTALRLTCAALVATFVVLGTSAAAQAVVSHAGGTPVIGGPKDTWGWE